MATAYIDALRMLGRRELSEAQVRDRLQRRQHDPGEIDAALERLRSERAVDDVRVAEAIARTQTGVKRRGKLRVRRQIEQAGVSPAIARRVTDEVFEALDPEALIAASLAKRLHGRDRIADPAEFSRLYRYLVGQGFEPDRVLAVLRKHEAGRAGTAGKAGRMGKAETIED
jgi:regulatory protein